MLCLLLRYRMCPRIAESETCGHFLRDDLRWSLDYGAQRIALSVGILAVSVINPPEPVAGFRFRNFARVHAPSEHEFVPRFVPVGHILLRPVRLILLP